MSRATTNQGETEMSTYTYIDKDGFENDGQCVPVKDVITPKLATYLFDMGGEGFQSQLTEIQEALDGGWKFIAVETVLALEGELENQLYYVEDLCEGWDDYDHLRVLVYTRMINSGIKKVRRTIRKFKVAA